MELQCTWRAGVFDRVDVRITGTDLHAELSLVEVMIVLGTKAVADLYQWNGATVYLSAPLAWPLRLRRPQTGGPGRVRTA